jgi:hypothetical protein
MITKERKDKTRNIIKKRVRQVKLSLMNPEKDKRLKQPHRLYKDGLGCKKPSCNICHNDKEHRPNEFVNEEEYE